MTIDKEIRAVALSCFHMDSDELNKILANMERIRPIASIGYAKDNRKDATCMVVKLGMITLGYVNVDDKRFVEPLLRDKESCEAVFLEVYREDGHAPIVRFTVTVDLDEVLPLVAGEGWKDWSYSFSRLNMPKELSSVEYTGQMLKDWIVRRRESDFNTLDEIVEGFINASFLDISVETSATYDDLLFYLEMSRNQNRELINRLQRGSTSRRTIKAREMFLKDWWPQFLSGDLVKLLCNDFAVSLKSKYTDVNDDILLEEYKRLEQELSKLPNGMYAHIDDINSLWACMYYSRIPKNKFMDVLSGIILHMKLKAYVDCKAPFIVQAQNNQYYQMFSGGQQNVINY